MHRRLASFFTPYALLFAMAIAALGAVPASAQDAGVRKTLQEAGITPAGGSAAAFGQHMRVEHDKWAELIRVQKITAE